MNKKVLYTIIDQWALEQPGKIAAIKSDRQLSYRQLGQQSNQIAQCLHRFSIQRNEAIATFLESGPEYLSAILGINKAGAAFMPIELKYPRLRLKYLLDIISPRIIITDSQHFDDLKALLDFIDYSTIHRIVVLDLPAIESWIFVEGKFEMEDREEYADTPLGLDVDGNDSAYFIYTSGSTGKYPKVIEGMHKSLSHFIHWEKKEFEIDNEVKVSQLAPLSFDVSLRDIFLPLLAGGTLCIPVAEERETPEQFLRWVASHSLSLIHTVPSFFRLLIGALEEAPELKACTNSINYILLAGEPLFGRDVQAWEKQTSSRIQLVNLYGPSETTLAKIFNRITSGNQFNANEIVPLGNPISNTSIAILNGNKLCGIGAVGEICIKTPFRSKGYFKNETLNKEKFVQNPLHNDYEDIIYKTGDLGRYLSDQSIAFVGRQDSQIKIRGNRVELGEVEKMLHQFSGVKQAIVLPFARENADLILIAYYTCSSDVDEQELNESLKDYLPVYMHPSYYLKLEAFPLNLNGKVDKKALPQPEELLYEKFKFVAPETALEEELATIWSEALGLKKVGVENSLFELGGHSLTATKIVGQIYRQLQLQLSLKELFQHPTIRQLAQLLEDKNTQSYKAIPLAPPSEDYPLSHAQRRLWIISRFENTETAYNLPFTYRFNGKFEEATFCKAWQTLVERHEILRTTFIEVSGEGRQLIHPAANWPVGPEVLDLSGDSEKTTKVEACIEKIAHYAFDLSTGPLYRASLIRTDAKEFLFVLNMHHLITDDWSMDVLHKELLTAYRDEQAGQASSLEPLTIQFKDFAWWQQEAFAVESHLQGLEAFWLQQFEIEAPVLQLPIDFPRPPIKSYNGAISQFELSEELCQPFAAFCEQNEISLFSGLLAVMKTLLYRYTGQKDLVMGTPVNGREHPDLQNQVGFYVNLLPLRMTWDGEMSFKTLVEQVHKVVLNAFENQLYPFDLLVEKLDIERDASRAPLFDIGFTWHDTINKAEEEQADFAVQDVPIEFASAKTDLWFHANKEGDSIEMHLEYCTDLFLPETIERFIHHFKQLFTAFVANPDLSLSEAPMFDAEEQAQLNQLSKGETRTLPIPSTIPALLRSQLEKFADHTALYFEGQSMSYRELDLAAEKLAWHLQEEMNIQQEDRVAVLLERGPDVIVALLAIMKAGGVYVPIDTDIPSERKAYILQDSGAKGLLTQSDYLFDLDFFKGQLFAMDLQLTELPQQAALPLAESKADSLAYLIYTSGSTGQPKGVMVPHQGLINMSLDQIRRMGIQAEDRVLQFASVSFDASVYEIFMALFSGATLVMVRPAVILEAENFIDYLKEAKVTVATLPPSYLNVLRPQRLNFLRVIITAGESPIVEDALACLEFSDYYNAYGPTECSVCVAAYKVEPSDADRKQLPIGKVLDNLEILLLDEAMNVVPQGVSGQICVAGTGLARGYINKEELTAQYFVDHPFKSGERLYKTGDQGRWLPDGNLQFEGRLDLQVKWHGHRIELEEIARCLERHPKVQTAVSLLTKDKSNLIACYTSVDKELDNKDLERHLMSYLPPYMLPAHLFYVEKMPLTSNGKIDRKALLNTLSVESNSSAYQMPTTASEYQLVKLCQKIFNRNSIGVKDNFFELGGNSLKAMQLVAAIQETCLVKISLNDVFTYPIIEDLAAQIAQQQLQHFESIPLAATMEHYPLSHAQRRLWVLSRFEEADSTYNIPMTYSINGAINRDLLEQSWSLLVDRHESLRTNFIEVNGEARQQIHPAAEVATTLHYLDIRKEQDRSNAAKTFIEQQAELSFDLSKNQLSKISLLQIEDQKFLLVLTIHHIISDDWSLDVMHQELQLIYKALVDGRSIPLSPLRIQYKDYACWQQEQLKNSGELAQQRSYWLSQFEEGVPLVDFPADFDRPAVKTYDGKSYNFTIPADLTAALQRLNQSGQQALFPLLFTALKIVIYRYTGQNDIVMGTPVAGREHPDLLNQTGFYVNSLPIRTRFEKDWNFNQIFEAVNNQIKAALDHQLYPFDLLVEELDITRDSSRSPVFDLGFTWHGTAMTVKEEATLITFEEELDDLASAKADLWFHASLEGEEISMSIEYASDLFATTSIERLSQHVISILHGITEQPEAKVSHIAMLSQKEENHLLTTLKGADQDYPLQQAITALFEEQVAQQPDAKALVFNDQVYTYQQLNEKANQLANYLLTEQKLQPEERVAVMLDRSPSYVISILGILKAGGAFVPIDNSLPIGRKEFMVKDASAKVLITQSDYLFDLGFFDGTLFAVDIQLDALETSTANPAPIESSRNLAYVIYTSGSTGQPKGVLIEHRGVVNMSLDQINVFGVEQDDRVVQFASVSFDASVSEVFMALFKGATLVLVEEETIKDHLAFLQFLKTQQITVATIPPAYLNVIDLDELKGLKVLITAGESPNADKIRYCSQFCNVFNAYGPSEYSVCVSMHKVGPNDEDRHNIPIGQPIANTEVLILDDQHRLLPFGASGMIAVAGPGLARGYLNREELTAEKFIDHPYNKGEKLYLTGDLGQWLPDGSLSFAGRKDHQVKWRGYRIELEEISLQLQNVSELNAALTLLVGEEKENAILVAFYTADRDILDSELQEFLQQELPAYMIPSHFLQLEQFPLNNSGKMDRKALVAMLDDSFGTKTEYQAPRNATEEQLVAVFEKLFDRANISIKEDFFGLGGQSLKAIQLLGAIQQQFGVMLKLRTIFSHPIITQLAKVIDETQQSGQNQIIALKEQPHYSLSQAQKRLWFISQFEQSATAFNLPAVYSLESQLDTAAFQQAWQMIMERHEILRTTFDEVDGEARQFVQAASAESLELIDWRKEKNSEALAEKEIKAIIETSFDLRNGPLIICKLLRVGEEKAYLAMNMHHIIADGWSIDLIYNEFLSSYELLRQAKAVELTALPIQYKDYASWQQEEIQNNNQYDLDRQFWMQQFEDGIPTLELPTDFPRPAVKTYAGESLEIQIQKTQVNELQAICQKQDATLFSGVLTTLNCLLQTYTGQQDLVIGIDVSGRDHADLHQQVGFYINRLAIRNQLDTNKSFDTLLSTVHERLLESFEHQTYPFDLLVEDLNIKRDLSRSPLFDVGITWNTSEMQQFPENEELTIEECEFDYASAKADLWFHFFYNGQNLNLSVVYNTDLFQKDTVARMLSQFEHLLSTFSQAPQQALKECKLITTTEQSQVLESFNPTTDSTSTETDVLDLFHQQVKQNGAEVALSFEGNVLTYKELDHKTEQLAGYLQQEAGVKANDRVALILERSPEMIISILATLKAGAAFVPVDPHLPEARQQFVLEDAAPAMVITQSDYLFNLQGFKGALFAVDIQLDGLEDIKVPPSAVKADQLAYVIYTSGSTGQPKGVGVSRASLANYINWANGFYFKEKEKQVFGLFTLMTFDLSLTAIFTSLSRGGELKLYPEKDPAVLLTESLSAESNVDTLKLTPSHIDMLMAMKDERQLAPLKSLILGGEALKERQLKFLLETFEGIKIYNEYGPTEATVGCIVKAISQPSDFRSIGEPIANTRIYILGNEQQLLPLGAWGELAIAGKGLANSYLNRPELNAQKFVKDPFYPNTDSGRMYLTGDIARWLPNGEIEFKGRRDRQVKVMGYRIELDEIEIALNGLAGIAEAAVLANKDTSGEASLAAYYTTTTALSADQIKEQLSQQLPAYMVPLAFQPIEKMPVTRSGKLDYKALAAKGLVMSRAAFIAAETPLQKQMAIIWQEVLAAEEVGLNDNFFDLGGHSLKATMLISRVQLEITAAIELVDLFNNPNFKDFAEVVESRKSSSTQLATIPRTEEQEHYPVSNAQRRLWVLNQFEASKTAYNVVESFSFKGEIDKALLSQAIDNVVNRHEILRTTFITVNGEPRQQIIAADQFSNALQFEDLSEHSDATSALRKFLDEKNGYAFDLETGPLFACHLIKQQEGEYVFLMLLHHIVCDGWSLEILMNEIISNYNGLTKDDQFKPADLSLQYKDYATWQNEKINSGALEEHQAYWLDVCKGPIPVLELPTDFSRPPLRTFNGQIVGTVFNKQRRAQLEQLAADKQSSLFMLMVASIKTLLYKYTQQKDIIIGSPSAGRVHQELEDQIGFYINNLIIRTQIDTSASFDVLLEQVKQANLNAHRYQEYPFDMLVEQLNLKKDLSRSPVFDVVVVMQNFNHIYIGDDASPIEMDSFDSGFRTNTTDLRIVFMMTEEELELKIDYNTDLFRKERMERMLSHFSTLVNAIVEDSSRTIDELNCIPAFEQKQLLEQFNINERAFSSDKILPQLFEKQAEIHANKIAVEDKDSSLTFQELNQRANQLAHYLREEANIKPNELVAVLCDRSPDMIVALLAILKAGGAYVPVDPAYPEERKKYLLDDTKARLILTQSSFLFDLSFYEGELFALDIQLAMLETSTENPAVITTPEDLAYVIYTSGSTGYPKGVMIAHRSCINMVESQMERFGIIEEDKVMQFASIGFDASVSEIFKTLLAGATLVLVEKSTINNLIAFNNYLNEKAVSVVTLPPPFLKLLDPKAMPSMRAMITAGSSAYVEDVRACLPHMQYFNAYGPTEYSVCISIYPCSDLLPSAVKVPIGYPIANTNVYLLDQQMQLVPVGVEGELYVSGEGLAKGYWGKPELTAKSFIANPFEEGKLMYKTGDKGVWSEEGALLFMGRGDNQVKVRGYRIELEEIESVVERLEGIRRCFTFLKKVEQEQKLIAYYQTEKGQQVDGASIRAHLQKWLPEYMLPDFFMELEDIPLNFSGKIDVDALPLPSGMSLETVPFSPPTNEVEQYLVDIWQDVLGFPEIGIQHRFFDLGGDSIKAIQVAARMHQKGYQLEVRDIFQYNSIQEIALNIRHLQRSIDQAEVSGEVPLTPIQQWFFSSEAKEPHHYNQSVLIKVPSSLSMEELKKVFAKIMEHHDALRMVFIQDETGIVQINQGTELLPEFDYFDLSDSKDTAAALNSRAEDLQRNFQLDKGPLMRVALFKTKEESRLLLIIHHLLVDGVSWRILFEDTAQLLDQVQRRAQLSLPPKTDAFKRWAEGLKSYADSPNALKELSYWKEVCSHSAENVPADKVSATPSLLKDSKVVSFELDKPATEALLLRANRAFNTQINDLLLTALSRAMYQQFGLKSIVIGLEGHGREEILKDVDISRTVGWFTSDYPVALNMAFAEEMERQIKETKETLRQIPNKGIGYGLLRYLSQSLSAEERAALAIQPQLSFNYLGQFAESLSEDSAYEVADEPSGSQRSVEEQMKVDFELSAMIFDGQFRLDINYNTLQFSEALTQQLGQSFIDELTSVIALCENKKEAEITPSDVSRVQLSLEDFDEIFD